MVKMLPKKKFCKMSIHKLRDTCSYSRGNIPRKYSTNRRTTKKKHNIVRNQLHSLLNL